MSIQVKLNKQEENELEEEDLESAFFLQHDAASTISAARER